MEYTMKQILDEIEGVVQGISHESLEQIAVQLQSAKRIFVAGEGRSGLMAKSFAMRLMHLGATVFVVGETTSPAVQADDTLVLVSGSGKSKSVVWTAEKAQELGCEIIVFTSNVESELAKAASSIVHVPAATKYRRDGERESIQPLGSLFDQCMHIVFDFLCLRYSHLQKVEHSKAFQLHSNLE